MVKIAVLALFKNVERYLNKYLFKHLEKMENENKYEFHYYFLENDSTDLTRFLLETFLENRNGKLFTLNDVKSEVFKKDAVTYERVKLFVYLRNYLLDNIRVYLKDVDYVMILDADVFFEGTKTITELIKVLETNDNLVMISPYQYEYTNKEKLSKVVPLESLDHIDEPIFSVGHNYDTFAIEYEDGSITWPFCRFQRCNLCTNIDCNIDDFIDPDISLVMVNSCFNGLCLIRSTDVFQNKELKYDTINVKTRCISLCEHIMFCNRLRVLTGKQIAIAQNISIKAFTAV